MSDFYHKILRITATTALVLCTAITAQAVTAQAAGQSAEALEGTAAEESVQLSSGGENLQAKNSAGTDSAERSADDVSANRETDADVISPTSASEQSQNEFPSETAATKASEQESETARQIEAKSSIPAPVLVSAKAGSSGITVKWKKIAAKYRVRKYLIFRKEDGDKYRRVAQQAASRGTSWMDKTALAGHTYIYSVRAYGVTGGKLTLSGYYTAGVTATARIPSVSLKSVKAVSGKVTVRWEMIRGVSGYRVYRKTGNGAYQKVADLDGMRTVRFTDSDCETGRRYTYTVRAYVQDGTRIRLGSFERKGMTVQLPVGTARMRSVRAGDGRVYVAWTPVKGADGYILYRRTGTGSFGKIQTLDGNMRNCFWDWTAKPGRRYSYKVAAYVQVGSKKASAASSKASATVTALPATPLIAFVRQSGNWDVVQWNQSSGADGYLFYRKTESGSWKLVKELKAKTTKIRVKRSPGERSYRIRAFVNVGGKRKLSSYTDSVTLSDSNHSDQKILFLGDSITYGFMRSYGSSKLKTRVAYPQRVGLLTGARITNRSFVSETLAYRSSGNSLIARIHRGQIRLSGASVIFVALGTNDYGHSIRLGQPSDSGMTTFCGALNRFMSAVKEQNPNAKVVFMTPIYRTRFQYDWEKAGYQVKNQAGSTLSDYCDAIVQIAQANGAYVLDSRTESVITAKNAGQLLYDGLHPNEEGHAAIAKSVAAYLENHVFSAE